VLARITGFAEGGRAIAAQTGLTVGFVAIAVGRFKKTLS
jgi:hypothetical protein